ncbi:hypothetical protein Ancab_005678 [Ancistrocladus abbreviatus]
MMENQPGHVGTEEENVELPPGFRFHPTDEELITHYLSQKVLDSTFSARAIGDVDLNKVEPWDLPSKAKMGEKEWYFFCVRDRKYPTGLRTNRATEAGYWKATGKDREIYRNKALIGMKKTLVFYTGRAPKGEKTNFVMHEYRLEGKYSKYNLPKTAKNEWVISRVFNKSSSAKLKTHVSGLPKISSNGDDQTQHPFLPPLMDSSETKVPKGNMVSHVTCFSSLMENNSAINNNNSSTVDSRSNYYYNPCSSVLLPTASSSSSPFPKFPTGPNYAHQLQYPESSSFLLQQDQSILKLLLEGNGSNLTTTKAELSQDTGISGGDGNTDMSSAVSYHHMLPGPFEDQEIPSHVAGPPAAPIDLDCFLNY